MNKPWLAFICLIPLVAELWNDRHGDKRKINDALAIIGAYLVIWFAATWSGKMGPPLEILAKVTALAIAYRILFFDYLINIILWHNHVIEHPEARKWWSYTGQTSHIDKISWWVKMGWRWRLVVRIGVFTLGMAYFIR